MANILVRLMCHPHDTPSTRHQATSVPRSGFFECSASWARMLQKGCRNSERSIEKVPVSIGRPVTLMRHVYGRCGDENDGSEVVTDRKTELVKDVKPNLITSKGQTHVSPQFTTTLLQHA